jgi:hypothetical protein
MNLTQEQCEMFNAILQSTEEPLFEVSPDRELTADERHELASLALLCRQEAGYEGNRREWRYWDDVLDRLQNSERLAS